MNITPPSPLSQYLQSGYAASSGVDAALLNASATANMPTNALDEQLANLQLPAYESNFLPADYWDYTNPATLSHDPMQSAITATGDAAGSSALAAGLETFSLFGLGPMESWLIVGAVAYYVFGASKTHGGRR